jgi:hypothetical protein
MLAKKFDPFATLERQPPHFRPHFPIPQYAGSCPESSIAHSVHEHHAHGSPQDYHEPVPLEEHKHRNEAVKLVNV